MSTQTPKAPSIADCQALNLVNGHVRGDRYYGKVNDNVGLCVYTVGDGPNYFAQLFPLPGPAADLHECFVHFVLALGNNFDEEARKLRAQYQYIVRAEDVLTLKCLVHEAENRWREYNERMEAGDTGREAGESVE